MSTKVPTITMKRAEDGSTVVINKGDQKNIELYQSQGFEEFDPNAQPEEESQSSDGDSNSDPDGNPEENSEENQNDDENDSDDE